MVWNLWVKLAVLLLLCVFYGCKKEILQDDANNHYRILFYNNSHRDVYVFDVCDCSPDNLKLLSVLSCFLLQGCLQLLIDNSVSHSRILFYNNSDNDLYVYGVEEPSYKEMVGDPVHTVYANTVSKRALNIDELYETKMVNDTLHIYVYDVKTLNASKDVRKAFVYEYRLSLSDLNRLDWLLIYPPTDSLSALNP